MATNTLEMNAIKEPIDLASYLCRRLKEVGISSVHGLPGDYNLHFLDYIEKEKLQWVGNVNELNASYAADGYARVKGMGAVVTTPSRYEIERRVAIPNLPFAILGSPASMFYFVAINPVTGVVKVPNMTLRQKAAPTRDVIVPIRLDPGNGHGR
ncbi:Pyruvate decarboxylase 1 [Ascosphaera pollenicola]|nr:Pyruvate decarboxylase 1 [Ascosphaera pollenicola]